MRASFSVPGKGGVAAVQNDPFEEDERTGRGLKPVRYVDKSELVLKETTEDNVASEETEAMVEEMDNPTINYNNSEALKLDDTTNAVAILENIIPGVNEDHIKTETKEIDEQHKEVSNNGNLQQQDGNGAVAEDDDHEQFSAKFAKFTLERNEQEVNDDDDLNATPTGRGK